MVLDHGAHDGEAETDAAGRPIVGLVETGEAVEDPLLGFDRHSRPVVVDGELGPPVRMVKADVDLTFGVTDGVVEQVAGDAGEGIGASGHDGVVDAGGRDLNRRGTLQRRDLVGDDDVEGDRSVRPRRCLVAPRQFHQVADDALEPDRVGQHAGSDRTSVDRIGVDRVTDFELRPDARQRAAQLVRGVGHEAPFVIPGTLQPFEHRVHRRRQPGDLVVGWWDVDALFERRPRNRLDGGAELLDGAQRASDEQPGDEPDQQHEDRRAPPQGVDQGGHTRPDVVER